MSIEEEIDYAKFLNIEELMKIIEETGKKIEKNVFEKNVSRIQLYTNKSYIGRFDETNLRYYKQNQIVHLTSKDRTARMTFDKDDEMEFLYYGEILND